MKNIYEKLEYIQQNLKAPKGQYNSFGKYHYRSCEDIFEAVKPLLKETHTTLQTSDELIQVGERYYIKATAKLSDGESGQIIENSGYAREELEKKGMDGSQITGASSSYARKYALNGLFLIDDVKDSDSTNTHDKTLSEDLKQKGLLLKEFQSLVIDTQTDTDKVYAYYKVKSNVELTIPQLKEAIESMKKKVNK